MSSIIKSPFINYASNNKKIIQVDKDDPNIIGDGSKVDIYSSRKKISEIIKEEKQKAEKIADDLINKAVGEAECIVQEARYNAINITEEAYKKALEEGYQAGLSQGEQEADRIKEEANQILQQAYEQKNVMLKEIEPKMVNLLKDLVKSLTGYAIEKEEIILFLIRKGFLEIERFDHLTIHVSPDDFDYVNKNKNKLCENISEKVNVEILRDDTLNTNDCVIETKSGNIDCSLGTRLNGLISDLELLVNSLQG